VPARDGAGRGVARWAWVMRMGWWPRTDWHVTVERVVGEGRHAASWVEFVDGDDRYPGVCFFDLDADGLIARVTDFWPTPAEVPVSRAHLVERY
jgi:hypothetical protein